MSRLSNICLSRALANRVAKISVDLVQLPETFGFEISSYADLKQINQVGSMGAKCV